jgi:hypothetical protein
MIMGVTPLWRPADGYSEQLPNKPGAMTRPVGGTAPARKFVGAGSKLADVAVHDCQ